MEGLSRYNSISPALVQQFKEVDKKKTIGQKIKKLAVQIFSKYKADDARKKDLLMHQGHLARAGSNLPEMAKHFTDSLWGNKKAEKFVSELESMHVRELDEKDFKQVVSKLNTRLINLQPGDSFLIEHRSQKAGHAMVMRVKKNDDGGFTLFRTNTGAGLSDRTLHPTQKDENGNQLTQLTTVWDNLKNTDIITFYTNFEATSLSGNIPPKTLEKMVLTDEGLQEIGEGQEDLSLIQKFNALALHILGDPQPISVKDRPECFGKRQLGGSCTASCLWEASKFSMDKEARKEVKLEGRLQQLLHNYTLYKKGYDRTSTNKIMMLDQVERLKHQLGKSDELSALTGILDNIENKLSKTSQEIIEQQRFYNNMIQPTFTSKNNPISLKVIRPSVKQKKGHGIEISNPETTGYKSATSLHIKFERDEKGRPIGKHLHEDAYLLCFHTATGNEKKACFYADRITTHTYPDATVDPEIAKEICLISSTLANSLYENDTSRTGLAKGNFLFTLTEALATKHQLNEYLNPKRSSIAKLRVEQQDLSAYLGEDNVWLKSL